MNFPTYTRTLTKTRSSICDKEKTFGEGGVIVIEIHHYNINMEPLKISWNCGTVS
jgi:hypothetical protein